LVPTDQLNEAEYQIKPDKLFQKDNENLNRKVIYDYTTRYYLNEKINHLRAQLSEKKTLVIKARSLNAEPKPIQVALLTKNGDCYGKVIEIGTEMKEYEIAIKDLKKVKTVTMPRPYPTFLPYYFFNEKDNQINIEDLEGIQISIGPGLPQTKLTEQYSIGIVSLMLK